MVVILASSQPLEPAISAFWLIPFAAMLGAIAVAPFIHKEWWEKRYPMVALVLAVIASSYYLVGAGRAHRWLEGMSDYISFIVLLASLYTISGGIVIEISRKATPLANSALLLIGAILANLFGTTGAAMLLIRPYLRMNRNHLRPFHIVFFIFIVANVGGALTPMGDPPLFLGYLMGVPFWWTVEEMRTVWLVAVTLLLAIFFVIDTLDHRREERHHNHDGGPQVRILGIHNFIFILMVLFAIFQKGIFEIIPQIARHGPSLFLLVSLLFSREVLMIVAAVASYLLTPDPLHAHNEFHFGPIREVAILFAGIFATMIPAIQVMQNNADRIPLRTPGQFYFATGVLSSVLDNTPTYKTLLDTRLGTLDPKSVRLATDELHKMAHARTLDIPDDAKGSVRGAIASLVRYEPDALLSGTLTDEQIHVAFLLGMPAWKLFVLAISAGSVFWGACTYIGNGPNFMVKSIADASGAATPGFATYIWKYTLPILIPVYLVVWAIFFMAT